MGAFGDKLRKQREQRGIALETISNTTKISPRMLRALEEERFDQLPGGVFNKGFVRAYARQIGLNEEEAVSDYLTALRESQVTSQKILPDMRKGSADPVNDLPSAPPRVSPPRAAKPDFPPAPVPATSSRGNGNSVIREIHDNKVDSAPLVSAAAPPPISSSAGAEKPAAADKPAVAPSVTDRRQHDDRRTQERRIEARRIEERDAQTEAQPSIHQPDPLLADRFADQAADAGDSDTEYSVAPIFGPYTIAPPEPKRKPPVAVPWRQLTAALVLIFVVVAVWNLSHRDRPSSPTNTAANTTTDSASASSSAGPQPSASQPTSVDRQPKPSASSSPAQSAQPSPQASPSTAPSSLVPKSQPASAAPTKASAANTFPAQSSSNNTLASSSASTAPSSKALARAVSSKPPATFTLVIRADKTAWISITADGNLVAQETLIAPASTSVRASNQVVVRTGNAGGISFRMGDRDIPAQGLEGEIRTFTFDGASVKMSPPQAPASTH